MCGSKTVDTHENSHDVGRLINMLSHQLKRQMCIQEEEDSLTTNMQRLVLHLTCRNISMSSAKMGNHRCRPNDRDMSKDY